MLEHRAEKNLFLWCFFTDFERQNEAVRKQHIPLNNVTITVHAVQIAPYHLIYCLLDYLVDEQVPSTYSMFGIYFILEPDREYQWVFSQRNQQKRMPCKHRHQKMLY